MVHANEVITLLFDAGALLVLFMVLPVSYRFYMRFFIAAFICLVFSHFFTVMKGLFWAGFFNGLQHMSIMLSTFFLAFGLYKAGRDLNGDAGE